MNSDQNKRNFGGLTFPDLSEPMPGPLSLMAQQQKSSQPPPTPSPAVARMLKDLPPTLRTGALQRRSMHVLDRIAQRWQNPKELKRLLDELIFEGEQNRSGLSFDAIVELAEFNDYVKRAKLNSRPSIWDQAYGLV